MSFRRAAVALMLAPMFCGVSAMAVPYTAGGYLHIFKSSATIEGFNTFRGYGGPWVGDTGHTNTYLNGVPVTSPVLDQWVQIAVEDWDVPKNATAIFMSGILIISGGTKPEPVDVWTIERQAGTTQPADCNDRTNQAVIVREGDEIRTNASHFVPLGTFKDAHNHEHLGYEACFHVVVNYQPTLPPVGTVPSVAVNYRLEGFVSPDQ